MAKTWTAMTVVELTLSAPKFQRKAAPVQLLVPDPGAFRYRKTPLWTPPVSPYFSWAPAGIVSPDPRSVAWPQGPQAEPPAVRVENLTKTQAASQLALKLGAPLAYQELFQEMLNETS